MLIERAPNGTHVATVDAGAFFREAFCLPAGSYAARVQIVLSERAAGERICIGVRAINPPAQLDIFALDATAASRPLLDAILLRFRLETPQQVEIWGDAAANAATTMLRFISVVDAVDAEIDHEAFNSPALGPLRVCDLAMVLIGTTGVCNASCLHCPTNKPHRRTVPNSVMKIELFTKIVQELAAGGFAGRMQFAVFNEPLADPLLEQRLRLVKRLLPNVEISVPTNGALFDPNRHAFLVELADAVAVHVEGLSPEVYDRYMHPLKIDRVLPRVLAMLSLDRNNKVSIVAPVHKGNLAEVGAIQDFFQDGLERITSFFGILNRAWEEGPWRALSLAPVGGFCHPQYLRDFVIDWDGLVLACCNDFSRRNRLGDLNRETIAEVLQNEAFNQMMEIFRTKRWSDRDACRGCRIDDDGTVQRLVDATLANGRRTLRLSPRAFKHADGASRDVDGSIIVGWGGDPDDLVVFGPYRRFTSGRYQVVHSLLVTQVYGEDAALTMDVTRDYHTAVSWRQVDVLEPGPLDIAIDFELATSGLLEFRLSRSNLAFQHRGAVVYPR